MTTILKIFAGLFGYDYEALKHQSTISRQKVVTLGTLILIPVVLWFFSGFYLSFQMMGASWWASLLVGLVLGGIILIVDRSFVATPSLQRGGALKVIRVGFAIVSTVLGSLAIDMVLFSGDLAEYRLAKGEKEKELFAEEYKVSHGEEVERLKMEMESAKARHTELEQEYLYELDGRGGTGRFGAGKVAAAKAMAKDRAQVEAERLERLYQQTMVGLDERALEHAHTRSEKRSDALLSQVRDLHEFVMSDGFTLGFYLFFFVFVLMLEAFFMMYKSAVADTIFEHMLQAEEDFGMQRLEAYREQKGRLLRDQGLLGEDHARVKRLLEGGGSQRYI